MIGKRTSNGITAALAGVSAGLCLVMFVQPSVARSGQTPTADQAALAMHSGDSAAAVENFTIALNQASLTNDRRASILNDRAVAHMRLGQTKKAMDDFNAAVKLLPEYAAIYNNRGNLLLSLGLTKEAIKDFDRALLLAPGYAAAYNNRAGARAKQQEWRRAVEDYTQAVRLAPANPAPLSGRGRSYLNLSRPHAAMRDFSRSVDADARFAVGYRDRAEALIQLEDYEGAIEDLSRAIAFDVNNPAIYVVRGKAYLATDNLVAAVKDFSRAVELNTRYAKALELRGLTYALSGNTEEAFRDLNQALQLDPRSSAAFAFRAFVYKKTGQLDIASKDIANALGLDPDRADVYWAKAEVAEARGNTDQAIADLRKALRVDPSMRLAQVALERLGIGVDEERAVGKPTADGWQMYVQANRYLARHPKYPRIKVPLEMAGAGKPKILSWDVKDAPFRGIGVLRFRSGLAKTKTGKVETVHAAIVDLFEDRVVALELDAIGAKRSTWTWGDGTLTVASLDGASDKFVLRSGANRYAGSGQQRRWSRQGQTWSPWADSPPPRQRKPARRQKPKSLFDLLFN
jgi:tetratricopeptide (TPR) repeat protein